MKRLQKIQFSCISEQRAEKKSILFAKKEIKTNLI